MAAEGRRTAFRVLENDFQLLEVSFHLTAGRNETQSSVEIKIKHGAYRIMI